MKPLIAGLVLSLVLSSCAHARHIAVVADATFATAVFSIDDTETQACAAQILTPAACAAAGPKILAALQDVKAVTLALQATPNNVAVPKNLPDLLTDLTSVQAILGPVVSAPNAPSSLTTLAAQIQSAITQTIAVVKLFSGGQ